MSSSFRSATLVGVLAGAATGGILYLAYCWVIGMANDYRMLKNFEAVASKRLLLFLIGGASLGAILRGAMRKATK